MKKFLFIILLLFLIFTFSCKKNSSNYDEEIRTGLNRIYYFDKDEKLIKIEPTDIIKRDLIIDNKIRLDFYFNYIIKTNDESLLPKVLYQGSNFIYSLYVDNKLIGTIGDNKGNSHNVEFKKENDDEYIISEVDNIYLNLAQTGNYVIKYYYNYYANNKQITKEQTCSFRVE